MFIKLPNQIGIIIVAGRLIPLSKENVIEAEVVDKVFAILFQISRAKHFLRHNYA